MQTNKLHSFDAGDDSISIRAADGFTVATITDGKISVRGTDTLRPVELRWLAAIAEGFAGFYPIAAHLSQHAKGQVMLDKLPETE